MASFSARFPMDEITRLARSSGERLERDQIKILEVLGTQVLSFAQQDYRKKARGQSGADGTQWAKLQRSTLEARVRRRAPARRIVAQRKKLAEQIKVEVKRGAKGQAKVESLRKKRKELSTKMQSLVNQEAGRYEIGVDTGLQRSSGSPGFAGSDGKGGNLFRLSPAEITVGYHRTYSQHFDEKRPLLPREMPTAWGRRLDQLAEKWADKIINDTFRS